MNTATPSQESLIDKRVAPLEQQMADILHSHPVTSQAIEKDGLATVGTWQDDAFSRETDQPGEAWRQSVKD